MIMCQKLPGSLEDVSIAANVVMISGMGLFGEGRALARSMTLRDDVGFLVWLNSSSFRDLLGENKLPLNSSGDSVGILSLVT